MRWRRTFTCSSASRAFPPTSESMFSLLRRSSSSLVSLLRAQSSDTRRQYKRGHRRCSAARFSAAYCCRAFSFCWYISTMISFFCCRTFSWFSTWPLSRLRVARACSSSWCCSVGKWRWHCLWRRTSGASEGFNLDLERAGLEMEEGPSDLPGIFWPFLQWAAWSWNDRALPQRRSVWSEPGLGDLER